MAIKGKYKLLITTLLIVILGVLFYTFFVQVRQIKPDHIGLKIDINNPEIENIKTVRGYVIFMPLISQLEQYPTIVQIINYDSLKIIAKDGVSFYVKPSVSYQLDETKGAIYYKSCGNSFVEMNKTYLKELTKESYQSVAGLFNSDSVINNRLEYETKVKAQLALKLANSGLLLKNVVSNILTPKHIQEMINLRSQALQNAVLSESKIIQLQAEAREQFVIADAERRKDSAKYAALTPLAIQKIFIEKWDGKLNSNNVPKAFIDITEDKK